jgi:hypothetical protein
VVPNRIPRVVVWSPSSTTFATHHRRRRTTRTPLRVPPTHGLCGHEFRGPITYEGTERPSRVCQPCQDALPAYEAQRWQHAAESLDRERQNLATRLRTAEKELQAYRIQMERLHRTADSYVTQHSPPLYFVRDSGSPVGHHWD